MNKLFTTILFAVASVAAFGQAPPPPPATANCTPDQPGPNVSFSPDSVTNFPYASLGAPYLTVLQLFVPTQIANPFVAGDTLTVDSFKITSVSGLPVGFEYLTNPGSGLFVGGNAACATIGTIGGANVSDTIGTYPLLVNYTAYIAGVGGLPRSIDDYRIVIEGSVCTPNLLGPNVEFVPDSITNFPDAALGAYYETVLQLFVPTQIANPFVAGDTLTVDSFKITSLTGLPAGFEYRTNPASGLFIGGNAACSKIRTINGSNVSAAPGFYPLLVNYTAFIAGVGGLPRSIDDYHINIPDTANVVCTPTLLGPNVEFSPDSATNFPNANIGSSYLTVLQLFVPTKIENPFVAGDTLTVDSFKITSVTGLPTGFEYKTNPASGLFIGGNAACATIGTIAGANVDAPSGFYALLVNYTAYIASVGGLPRSIDDYHIIINSPEGIEYRDANAFGVLGTFPNPATNATNIEFGSNNVSDVTLNVYNSIGMLVYSTKHSAKKGSNVIKVSTSSLANGYYFYALNNGTNVVNGKFIVQK